MKIFRRKKQKKEVLPKVITEIKEMNDDEETENKDIAERIIKILKENPERRPEIVNWLGEQEELSNEIIEETAKQIPKEKEIPNFISAKLTEKLPDGRSLEVLHANPEGYTIDQTKKIIENIEDDKNKEKGIVIKLNDIYKKVTGLNDRQLREQINKLIAEYEMTEKIKKSICNIVARNFAKQYMAINGIMPNILEKIIPPEEMLREQMSEKIGFEYKRLLKLGQENKYDQKYVKKLLLERSAKNLVEIVKSQEEDDGQVGKESAYVQEMGMLTDDEKDYFLSCVKKYDRDIGTIGIMKLRNKLNGIPEEGDKVKKVLDKINELPEKDIETLIQVLDLDLVSCLSDNIRDSELREKVIDVMKNSVGAEKVEKRKPNIQKDVEKEH